MILTMSLLLASAALAAEQPRVVHAGETVESIAEALGGAEGVADVAPRIRELNALGPGEQPSVGAILLVPVLGAAGSTDHTHGSVVLALSGTGSASTPGGGELPLSLGLQLPEGSTVCTDDASYATVRLAVAFGGLYHDDITLLAKTCAVVQATRSSPASRVSLLSLSSGSVSVRSAREDPGTVTIQTRDGLTTGEHGGFRVTVESEASRTEALYSEVSVIGAGEELPLDAGYGSRVRRGEAPSPPVKLLPPGTPTRPLDGASLRRPDFVWTPADDALGYRVSIATAPDFSELILVEDVGSATWLPEVLLMPFRVPGLWWRVSSFDRTGFQGIPSEPSALLFPAGMGP